MGLPKRSFRNRLLESESRKSHLIWTIGMTRGAARFPQLLETQSANELTTAPRAIVNQPGP